MTDRTSGTPGLWCGGQASDAKEFTVSSRGVGGSGHGYTKVYLSRRGEALKVKIDFHHPRFRFLMAPWAPSAPSGFGLRMQKSLQFFYFRVRGENRKPKVRTRVPQTWVVNLK